jgi:hypothetical protein
LWFTPEGSVSTIWRSLRYVCEKARSWISVTTVAPPGIEVTVSGNTDGDGGSVVG